MAKMGRKKTSEGQRIIHAGSYVEGDVNVRGGDFVGGSKVVGGGLNAAEVQRLFADIVERVERRANTSGEDKAGLKVEVEAVQKEALKGDAAQESTLTYHLKNIQRMAPDILEVALAALASPLAGFGAAVRKIADKMKSDASK